MKPLAEQNYYEILEIPGDASPKVIEQAFERAMQFYGPESLATYTLTDGEESGHLLEAIEEAYLTLSDPELRREYDESRGCGAAAGSVEDAGGALLPPAPAAGQLAFGAILAAAGHYPWPGSRPEADEDGGPAGLEPVSDGPADPGALLGQVARVEAPAEPTLPPPGPLEQPAVETGAEDSAAESPGALRTVDGTAVESSSEEAISLPREEQAAPAASAATGSGAETAPALAVGPERPEPLAELAEPPAATALAATSDPAIVPSRSVEPSADTVEPPRPATPSRVPPPLPALPSGESTSAVATTDSPVAPAPEPGPVPATVPEVLAAEVRPEEPKPPPRSVPRSPEIPPNAVFNGELLRRVREGRGMSIRELADRTKIGLSHLENLEADRYDALPVPVYLRGFLMVVARELKLDPLKVSKSYLELVKAGAAKS